MTNLFYTLAAVFSFITAGNSLGFKFTTENIGEALLCAGAGMVGIFIVVGIIILCVSVLNKIGSGKKNDKK